MHFTDFRVTIVEKNKLLSLFFSYVVKRRIQTDT